ncbi:hypothetical protein [Streptomyces sp. NPDC008092]|uniref:hypothetical protein n=1 Tax=Streptomyces sp. NPDC008092 TaxID=3364808 RepID=UPI0036E8B914
MPPGDAPGRFTVARARATVARLGSPLSARAVQGARSATGRRGARTTAAHGGREEPGRAVRWAGVTGAAG